MKNSIKLAAGFLFVVCLIAAASAQSLTDASMEMARVRFKRGLTLFNDFSYLGAVEHFRSALSVYPQYHLSREYLARSYRLAGYTDEALTEWELLYDISGDISVKNKIDLLRYMRSSLPSGRQIPEYIEVKRINSRDLSYYHFTYPTDVATDSDKNLYICSFNTGKIIKLSHEGKGLATKRMENNSRMYGIDCREDVLVYSDFANDTVYISDTLFSVKASFGSKGTANGEFNGVQGVCFDSDGFIYAVDTGNHRVQKFSPEGRYLLQFGRHGEYEGEFTNPTDVASGENELFVSDTGNSRILVFDTSGNYLREIRNELFQSPRGINYHNGFLYISDTQSGLLILDVASGYLKQIDSWKDGEEKFSRLYASVFDRDGYLYLLDHDKQMLVTFSPIQNTYTNLDIEIRSVDTRKFPAVAFYISVRDRNGDPLYNLSPENFTVVEDNATIRRLAVDYLKKQKRKTTTIFCIDRSASMEKWHSELEWSADFYLKEMKVDDRVKIINVNSTDWLGNDYDWSRLRSLQALRQKQYQENPRLGRVLYNAVSELVSTNSSRAVVLFTDGQSGSEAFTQYDAQTVADYARIHYIPVYIVSLGGPNSTLEMIASQTGGAFISARNSEKLRGLYESVRDQEEYRYVVVYESFKEKSFSGWWSDVTIDVESQGRRGREWGGYFVP